MQERGGVTTRTESNEHVAQERNTRRNNEARKTPSTSHNNGPSQAMSTNMFCFFCRRSRTPGAALPCKRRSDDGLGPSGSGAERHDAFRPRPGRTRDEGEGLRIDQAQYRTHTHMHNHASRQATKDKQRRTMSNAKQPAQQQLSRNNRRQHRTTLDHDEQRQSDNGQSSRKASSTTRPIHACGPWGKHVCKECSAHGANTCAATLSQPRPQQQAGASCAHGAGLVGLNVSLMCLL